MEAKKTMTRRYVQGLEAKEEYIMGSKHNGKQEISGDSFYDFGIKKRFVGGVARRDF